VAETVQRFPRGMRVSIFLTPGIIEQSPWQLHAVTGDHPGWLLDYDDDGHALVLLEGWRGPVLRVPEWCVTRG
jgi:hypothetical protein